MGCAEKAYQAFCDNKKIAWIYVSGMTLITIVGFNYDIVVGKILGFD